MELLEECQQLEEELSQYVVDTQGSSLARFRINRRMRSGCHVDVCMTEENAFLIPKTGKSIPHTFCCHSSSSFVCPRRLSSFVWSGCILMNNCVRSPRATDQLTGRGEREGGTIQTTVPTPPHPLYMAVAPTTVEAVAAEAMATVLDMVNTFNIQIWFTSVPLLKKIHVVEQQEAYMLFICFISVLIKAPIQSSPMPLRLILSAEMSSATGPWLERIRTGELCSSVRHRGLQRCCLFF